MSELEELFTEEAPSLIGVGADALVENATRLGLTWVLRFGTVQTDDPLTVIVDGDTVPVSMVSLVGYLKAGTRVSVLIVSSKVHFVNGLLNAPATKALTDLQSAAASATLTLTTAMQNVTGAAVTVTANDDGALWTARAAVDIQWTTAAVVTGIAQLLVDGNAETAQALLSCDAAALSRATVYQQWTGTFASSGSHTLQLQGSKTNAGGVGRINHTHTTLHAEVFE